MSNQEESLQLKSRSLKLASVFINRNFFLLWLGQTISVSGDYVFTTTLLLWISNQIARGYSWAPLAVSGVILAATLPAFLFGPLAGVFVDRWNKRQTMLRMDLLRTCLILLMVPAAGVFPLPFAPDGKLPIFWQLGLMYVVMMLASVCSQLFSPARMTLISDLVEPEERAKATGLNQTTSRIALIFAPSLAAILLFGFGPLWAILLNAFSFFCSFLAILAVRLPEKRREVVVKPVQSVGRDFLDGLHFFRRNSILMFLLLSGILFMLGGGALNTLYVFFVPENLHVVPATIGLFGSVNGICAITGAIFFTTFARRIGEARISWISFLGMGSVILLFSRMVWLWPALLLFGLDGFFNAGLTVVVGPLMMRVTPREMLGRVSAIMTPFVMVAEMVSAALAGYLVSTVLYGFHATIAGLQFGSIDIIIAVIGLLTIGTSIYAMLALRVLPDKLPAPIQQNVLLDKAG